MGSKVRTPVAIGRSRFAFACASALAMLAAGALAAGAAMPTKEQKCEARKNRLAGEYADCMSAAEKKLVLFGDAAEYDEKVARCAEVLARDWQTAESKADCPTEGDATAVQDFLDGCHASVAAALAGAALPLDPSTCNSELQTCRAALADAASCDVAALPAGIAQPTCDATCDQVCDPVDTDTCIYRSGKWICDAPSCTCGSFTGTASCTMAPPACDPVCEPPTCGTKCESDQCGDTGCPVCEAGCGTPRCNLRCPADWPMQHPCGPVFDCELPIPTCTTSCRAPYCYWRNNETSGTPPACESTLPLPGSYVAFADKNGLDCSAPSGSQERDWEILCEKPECEIRCTDPGAETCPSSADCEVDCTDPVCTVTCDTPTCSTDPDTGANVCSPPANCTTSCACRIGTCARAD